MTGSVSYRSVGNANAISSFDEQQETRPGGSGNSNSIAIAGGDGIAGSFHGLSDTKRRTLRPRLILGRAWR